MDEKTPLVISRTLLQHFAISLPKLPPAVHKSVGRHLRNDRLHSISKSFAPKNNLLYFHRFFVIISTIPAHYALEKIQPRVVAFEEQVSVIRVDLAKLYEDEEEWKEAAKILIAIPLDSGQRYCLWSVIGKQLN